LLLGGEGRGGEGRGGERRKKGNTQYTLALAALWREATREESSDLLSWTRLGVFLFFSFLFFSSSSTPNTVNKVCRLGVGTQTFFINGKQNSTLLEISAQE
jgi:hypothetical protein